MSFDCFSVTYEGAVAHLTLNRPERRNAMTEAFWADLPLAVDEMSRKPGVRVIVVSAEGPHFCAGLDLSVFSGLLGGQTQPHSGHALYQTIRSLQRSLSCLEDCRLPVLAAVHGGVIGGALDFVTACDIRYATDDAYFCIEETNLGMTADVGTFPRLQKLMPEGVVRELAYTGRKLGAAEAQALGLVNAVLPTHEDLMEHVMGVAHEISKKAPMAVHGCKRTISWARDHSTADGLEHIALWNAGALSPAEIMEAIAARRDGREARFDELPPVE